MQFAKAALIAFLAAAVSADPISDLVAKIPACAQTCLIPAITASGCGLTDYVCQCTTGHNAILAKSAACVQSGCSTQDALTTTDVTNQICSLATAAGTSAAAGSSSAAAGASSVASSVASAVSSVASSAASVASSAASVASSAASVASSLGSAASSVSSTASAAASTATTTPASTTSAASAGAGSATSASAAATQSKSSGNTVQVGAGMVGAAILAAMAL